MCNMSPFFFPAGLIHMRDIQTLIGEAAGGDANAFDEIVRRYQNPAVAYAYSLLGSRVRAEDAAQEAFLQAWRDLALLRETATLGAWLRRIVFKYADRDHRRERVTVSLESVAETADGADPAREVFMNELQASVRDIVASLPDGERAAVTLFYMGGHSAGEVGAFLGLTEGAVKKRLERARKRLAERMVAIVSEELGDMAPGKETRFVEVARLLRQITQVADADGNVLAPYLAPFGSDEGFGAGNDAWASLNVHLVLRDEALPALATGRGEYIRRAGEPILWNDTQQNAPPRGYYQMAIYDAPAGPYEVDWYWYPATGATIPTDARILFNRGGVPVSDAKKRWDFTPESEYPDAIRRLWASRTPDEAHREETRNTIHLFWAMWLISAKYAARRPDETELPFAPMLRNLLADTRRNVHGGEWVRPTDANGAPTLAEKAALLRTLAGEMSALGQAPPDAVPRFLTLINP